MTDPRDHLIAQRLAELRARRGTRAEPAPASDLLRREAADLSRKARSLGAVGDAWSRAIPEELAARTALVGVSRGVLTVSCDASTRYQLDRFLREGGERELIRLCPVAVRKVRLIAGDP